VNLTLAHCFSPLFFSLYTYTYTYTYCYYYCVLRLRFFVLTKPALASVPVKASFVTIDTNDTVQTNDPFLVIHTGKLQPVLIWREKPVLLALLNNLGIPVPASYPVFRTKWREIS